MSFCTYCGKELGDKEVCTCAGAQETASKKKGVSFDTKKLIRYAITGAIIIALLIAIVSMVSYTQSEIDLNDYLIVDGVTGLNSRGVVKYHLDEDGIYNAMLGSSNDKEVTEDNWESVMTENLEKYEEIGNALSCITITASPEAGLSNGDVVTITAKFENTEGYELSHHFKDATKTLTVSGLPEGKEVDLFGDETISVQFSGISGTATADFECLATDEVFSLISYSLSSNTKLCNGDTVTLTAKFDSVKLEKLGYLAPTETTREYTVSGLTELLSSGSEVPSDALPDLYAQAIAHKEEDFAYWGYTEENIVLAPEVCGVYFVNANDPSTPYEHYFYGLKMTNAVVVIIHSIAEVKDFWSYTYDDWNVSVFPDCYLDESGNLVYEQPAQMKTGATSLEEVLNWFDQEFSDMTLSPVNTN